VIMQPIIKFIQEWFKMPIFVETIGIFAGFMIFITGVIWKNTRERKIGLVVMGLCLFSGIIMIILG
jgi:hypothetical protein